MPENNKHYFSSQELFLWEETIKGRTTRYALRIEPDELYDLDQLMEETIYPAHLILQGRHQPKVEITDILPKETPYVSLPLWIYEHSGISVSCGERKYPYNDRFDSRFGGYIYVTQQEMQGAFGSLPDWKTKATEILTKAVKNYDHILNNDVYMYSLYYTNESDVQFLENWNGEETVFGPFIGDELTESAIPEDIGHGFRKAWEENRVTIKHLKPIIFHTIIE